MASDPGAGAAPRRRRRSTPAPAGAVASVSPLRRCCGPYRTGSTARLQDRCPEELGRSTANASVIQRGRAAHRRGHRHLHHRPGVGCEPGVRLRGREGGTGCATSARSARAKPRVRRCRCAAGSTWTLRGDAGIPAPAAISRLAWCAGPARPEADWRCASRAAGAGDRRRRRHAGCAGRPIFLPQDEMTSAWARPPLGARDAFRPGRRRRAAGAAAGWRPGVRPRRSRLVASPAHSRTQLSAGALAARQRRRAGRVGGPGLARDQLRRGCAARPDVGLDRASSGPGSPRPGSLADHDDPIQRHPCRATPSASSCGGGGFKATAERLICCTRTRSSTGVPRRGGGPPGRPALARTASASSWPRSPASWLGAAVLRPALWRPGPDGTRAVSLPGRPGRWAG